MMKKLVALMIMALLMVGIASAEEADLFSQIQGKTFEFCSGAGGWSTELTVGENGTFTGNYHDSEMGETGEGYPDGTMYGCTFHGQFSEPEKIDEYRWTVKISTALDEGQGQEKIEDNVRYVTSAPYGVEKATTVTFFLPGLPVAQLPEEFIPWTYLYENARKETEISYYAFWNEEEGAGFLCYPATESQAAEHTVVTALAAEVNPDHLVSIAFDAKIRSYADGLFTITILVPEQYDPEEIAALKIGDGIYTEGREIEVKSIEDKDGYLVLNANTDDEVILFESIDRNYRIAKFNDNTWLELATVTVPAAEGFLFLDGIDLHSGETLLHPTVHNLTDFLEQMKSSDDPGFDIRNVEVVIDEEGKLAIIKRFYVSWQ